MKCPKCQHAQAYVLETRTTAAGIRRRRRCDCCGARFSTLENAVPEGTPWDQPMSLVPATRGRDRARKVSP